MKINIFLICLDLIMALICGAVFLRYTHSLHTQAAEVFTGVQDLEKWEAWKPNPSKKDTKQVKFCFHTSNGDCLK